MRIVLTGGGTSGHVTPFGPMIEAIHTYHVTHASQLPGRLVPHRLDLYFVGFVNPETRDFFQRYNVKTIHIPSGKVRRYFSWSTIYDLGIKLPAGLVWSLITMWGLMPDVVISKGGYGSIPVALAAVFYRIPILLHESDAVPSLTTRLLARMAAAIGVGFPQTRQALTSFKAKTFVTGTPIRSEFRLVQRSEARQVFGLPDDKTALLVLGGSQGAKQINEVLLQVLPQLVLKAFIIHVTGKHHYEAVKAVADELLSSSSQRENYKPYPYLKDKIVHALVAADVVISRAGATTLAELSFLHKPSLLIPLASAANDHQRRNAEVFEVVGAARVLDPNNLKPTLFARNVEELITDATLRQSLSTRIGALSFPKAAPMMADLAFKLAAGLRPVASD